MKLFELAKRINILSVKRRMLSHKAACDSGLYLGQPPIIEYIIEHSGCSQIEIAETLNLSPASVAISTKRLEKAGMLEKAIDESNLRSKKLTVTDKGRKTVENCRKLFDAIDRRMFEGFSEEEQVQLKDYLDRMIANISDGQDKGSNISFYELIAMVNQLKKNRESSKEEGD